VVSGILLFAVFIHRNGALRYVAIFGLAGAAVLTGYLTRRTPILVSLGLLRPDRKTLFYMVLAILIGLSLGILTRYSFELSLLPAAFGSLALLSPSIGIMEELVFRGFLQGHLRPLGRIPSVLSASLAHTGYKLLLISSLPGPFQFHLLSLVIWTFLGGTLFGIIRERSGSSIPPATAHALFDIILYGGMSAAPPWVWS
jgi:membrane protease YdiL (CAAX protease family)